MIKIRLIGCLIFFVVLKVNGQDTSLYQGTSDIFLLSGSSILHVKLWNISPIQVEYVKNGSISDVLNREVKKIVNRNYEITFDEQNQVVKKVYDQIIQFSGDTLRGFIVNVLNDSCLEYRSVNSARIKKVGYSKYVICKNFATEDSMTKITDVFNLVEKESKIQEIEIKAKKYPGGKNTSYTKDLILLHTGDSIFCTIVKDDSVKINYEVPSYYNKLKGVIYKSEIRHYYFYLYNSNVEAYDAEVSAKYQKENTYLTFYNDDLIETRVGDHIKCNIMKVTDGDIYYYIAIKGTDPKIRISRSLVKEYKTDDE